MIQGINEQSNVFAHVAVDIIRTLQELRRLINQVGCKDLGNNTLLISLVEFVQTAGEKAECGENKDASCFARLQFLCNLQHTVARGNHIIHNDHVLSFDIASQKFMGDNGVAAVDYLGVVSSLVKHTHIQAQNIGQVDGA